MSPEYRREYKQSNEARANKPDKVGSLGPLQKKVLEGLRTASEEEPIPLWELAEIVCSGEKNKSVYTIKSEVSTTLNSKAFNAKLADLGFEISCRDVEVKGIGRRRGYYLAPIEAGTSGETS